MENSLCWLLVVFLQLTCVRGDLCNNTIAPSLCADDQQECTQDVDEFGCDAGTYCFPTVANGCFVFCPLTCKLGEIFCQGVIQPDGCPSPPKCLPRYDPETGCLNHCDIECPAGFVACAGIREDCCGARKECCKPAPSCIEEVVGCTRQNVDEEGCPFFHFEPTSCNPPQIHCEGGHDQNGCTKPSYCHMPPYRDDHPNCTNFCPAACNLLFEYACPTNYDINGCANPPTCMMFGGQCPENKHFEYDGCPIEPRQNCTDDQTRCYHGMVYKSELTAEEVFEPLTLCSLESTCINAFGAGDNEGCIQPCPTDCRRVTFFS